MTKEKYLSILQRMLTQAKLNHGTHAFPDSEFYLSLNNDAYTGLIQMDECDSRSSFIDGTFYYSHQADRYLIKPDNTVNFMELKRR